MEFNQPVVVANSPVLTESPRLKTDCPTQDSTNFTVDANRKEEFIGNANKSIGILEVYIHQARDIHNICIYHKQDVYAKLTLTSEPEQSVSTQIINGGGKNPVFNERLQLNVHTIDSSLKCEIWMLSRVRNYLQDQLLGFTLVPLSDVLVENAKPAREFSLSSSDLFHSPAGFVQLTLTYTGASPEVLEIPPLGCPLAVKVTDKDSGASDSISSVLDKIEFPDPKIVNENEIMVSEYIEIHCENLESQCSEQFGSSENGNHNCTENDVPILDGEELGGLRGHDTEAVEKIENPLSIATNGPPLAPSSSSSHSVSDTVQTSISQKQEDVSVKGAKEDAGVESASPAVNSFAPPLINISIEPEQKVVQQEIVDMYMKSMQQFTEALAKMKLPLDIESGSSTQNGKGNPENFNSEDKAQESKGAPSPRVFYGSRAFF